MDEISDEDLQQLESRLIAGGRSADEAAAFVARLRAVKESPVYERFRSGWLASDERAKRPVTEDEIGTLLDDDMLIERVYQRLFERYGVTSPVGSGLPDLQRAFVATTWFEYDSFNGGLSQYVMNQYDAAEGSLALVIEGYERMGIAAMRHLSAQVLAIVEQERDLRAQLHGSDADPDPWVRYAEQTALAEHDDHLIETVAERAAFVRRHAADFAG
jgi:hypothetical protein